MKPIDPQKQLDLTPFEINQVLQILGVYPSFAYHFKTFGPFFNKFLTNAIGRGETDFTLDIPYSCTAHRIAYGLKPRIPTTITINGHAPFFFGQGSENIKYVLNGSGDSFLFGAKNVDVTINGRVFGQVELHNSTLRSSNQEVLDHYKMWVYNTQLLLVNKDGSEELYFDNRE